MRVAKAMVMTALMAAAGVAHAGDSAKMVLDLRTGPRASGGDETLAFSSLWDGGADATVTIAQDGVAIAGNLAGEGERAWSVPYNGTYELTHVTYTNGVAGKVETATFVVTGKAEPPEITDVVATPGEPWDGTVGISFNVVNSPAAACPDWNRPYLSIVATDNLTGSNYVSVASALSGDTDTADGPHTVTWDMGAQGIDFFSTNVTFTVAYLRMPDWCVIDLSGGKDAAHYPVTYVSNVPKVSNVPDVPGVTFNADAYKTTNLVMRLVGPGTFEMGDSGSTETTEITNAFYCAVFETTQRQWELVTGERPSWFTNETYYATRPVERVSWNMIRGDANTYDWPNVQGVAFDSFVGVLRQKTDLDALDLPTEAQWEYVCRAGTTSKYNNGGDTEGDLKVLGRYWYNGGSGSSDSCATDHGTAAVGSYLPNAWGLYDMHGNVFEWCLERYSSSGAYRVLRGGGLSSGAGYCTSSYRGFNYPSYGDISFGFRLVRTLSNNLEGERSAEAAAGAERAGTVCAGTSAPVEVGAPPPEVTDVVATPTGGAWQGQVDISFNVTNSPAAACPGWNAPVLSIVATDHLTGSNYVADVSALSARAPYHLAAALAGSNGTHAVTWDFTAQGIDFSSTNVTFTVAYLRMPDYCVIDLSGGTNAAHYAVSYLDAEPDGGWTNDLYRTTKLAMRLIAPGTFEMGSDRDSHNRRHAVTLTNAYYIAVFETTQRQWELVTGGKPSYFNNADHYATRPVEKVSYDMIRGTSDGAQWPAGRGVDGGSFMGALRQKTGLAAFDLPTEAQWEHACRAGTATDYNSNKNMENSGEDANMGEVGRYWCNGGQDFSRNCDPNAGTATVGSYAPNAWGLYDMHGNVFEWCLDWYADLADAATEPVGPESGQYGNYRVLRGGSWLFSAYYCTSSFRDYLYFPSDDDYSRGFRLARTLSRNIKSERSAEAAAGAERAGTVCAGASAPVALVRGASVAFRGKFTLTGRAMAADEFTAGLYDAAGNQLQTVVNAADGTFAFDAIEYTPQDAGTHVYTVRQEAGADAGILYDTAEYTVTVAVSVGADRLVVTPTDNFTNLDFANVCPPPEITDVVAEPGAPGSGTVTISFNVTNSPAAVCPGWNAPFLSIVATDNVTGSNYVSAATALTGQTDAAEGAHEVIWNLDAQGIDLDSTNITFTVAYLKMPDYCVLDLSGGTNATSYAVSYLDAEPDGGFTNALYKTTNLVMRLLAPGSFQMGVDGSDADNPPHSVTLTQPFYCAVFETTQRQWELVKGGNPSSYQGGTRPVEYVSYNDIRGSSAVADWPANNSVDDGSFLGVLRSKTGLASLDLPTEAQWEYACRAGTTNQYNGVDTQDLGQLGRYRDNCNDGRGGYSQHTVVGSYLPNAWGLYDMHGNVWEWCLDRWNGRLGNTSVTNPLSSSGSDRVERGGSWRSDAYGCTSSYRVSNDPSDASNYDGFRLVRTLSNNFESECSAEAAAGAERAGTVCAGESEPISLTRRASVAFSGKFTLTGRDMAPGEFTAGLYFGETLLQTATNAVDGTFEFEPLQYTWAERGAHYAYTVKQQAGTAGGVQYDATEHTVEVVVLDDGNGGLKVNLSDNFTALNFSNVYSATCTAEVKVRKDLQGRPWASDDRFEFTLAPVGDAPAFPTSSVGITKNTEDHVASFGTVTFTQAGDYSYTVNETRGALPGMAYDGAQHTVTFSLTDDGQGNLVASDGGGLVQTVEITNTYSSGDFTVSNRVVSSTAADRTLDFSFTVTLADTTINGTYGGMSFTDGVAVFTLKDGETATASGLPAGVGYTVAQTADDGFTTSSENASGTITREGATASFTNTRKEVGLAVTAGKWGVVAVETNGVALAAVGPDATTNLVITYGSSVTATAVPSAGFAVLGGTNSFSFASFTADTSVAFSFVPNPAAALRWKFSSAIGRYFAQVAIPAHAGYAEALEGLAYVFADRTNNVGDVYAQLWNVAARAPQGVLVTDNGVEYRGVTLGSASFAGMPDGTTNVFGVADASFNEPRNIVPAGERKIGLYVRKRVNPVSGNETDAEVQDFLGYLTWTTDGTRYFMPIVENDSNGPVSTQAERPSSSLQYSFPVMQHAYAPEALNAAAALGLQAAAVAENPPTARIAAFSVGADGAVSGRIEAVAGGEASSSFGGSATVRVLSAETPAGPWREASAAVDPATGAFALPAGSINGHFFRAEIETRAVYE